MSAEWVVATKSPSNFAHAVVRREGTAVLTRCRRTLIEPRTLPEIQVPNAARVPPACHLCLVRGEGFAERVLAFIEEHPGATVGDLVEALRIGRKIIERELHALEREKKATRNRSRWDVAS